MKLIKTIPKEAYLFISHLQAGTQNDNLTAELQKLSQKSFVNNLHPDLYSFFKEIKYRGKGLADTGGTRNKKISTQFSVLHQNIQSIGNVKLQVKQLVIENNSVKVLFFNEHWKTQEQLLNHPVPNFRLITSYCRFNGEHGGVEIYVSSDIKAYERKDINKVSKKWKFECAGIEFHIYGKKIVCITVYKNGNTSDITERLEPILERLAK
ncbi:hypothetical protein HHI36_008419 [Cryptolaemus montrouzieri]|uniref:Uncharacterized protein n=1 Tax=Cryptolaemus montrouzieri TaxID=559131 RepID=A0ABD2MSY4_9CUCU